MPTDLGAFVGRFHPLLVHLPIGFLLIAAFVDLLSRTARHAGLDRIMPTLLALCALSAIAAACTGLLLAPAGGYDGLLVLKHQSLGIAFAVATVLTWAAASLRARRPSRIAHGGYRVLLVASLLLLGATGHVGGSITHGETFLTEHMPAIPWFGRAAAPAPAAVDPSATPVFATLVAPTLDASCVPCHGPGRAEGRLRLDSAKGLAKGGQSGAVIAAGLSARSEIVRRIWLPPSHTKAMPPPGHRPVSHAEAALLRWWIDPGASFAQTLADAEGRTELEQEIAMAIG
ncbi:MAG: c-type cytochrome domain-containing protein, partial [Luteitalea sp.]